MSDYTDADNAAEVVERLAREVERPTVISEPALQTPGVFLSKPVHLPPAEPVIVPILCATLQGLVDVARTLLDEPLLFHISDTCRVELVSAVVEGRHKQRAVYAAAHYEAPWATSYNIFSARWLEVEDFVIGLRAYVEKSIAREQLLKYLGNVADENVKTSNDDGITQTIQTKSGATGRADVAISPDIHLGSRYWTFPEAGVQYGDFLFRLRKGEAGGGPTCRLIGIDPDAYLRQVEAIAAFLLSVEPGGAVPVIR